MIIKGKDKEYELTFKSRQMIKLGEEIGGQYDLQKGAYDGDIKILAKMLSIFCDTLDYDNALDLIDELIEEHSIKEIYTMIFDEMNKKAFFTEKLEVQDFPPINMESYVQKMMDSMGTELTEQARQEAMQNMLKVSKN